MRSQTSRSRLWVIALLLSVIGTGRAAVPDADQLEEITVTVQKRAELSQDVPLTVHTVSADEMSQAGVRNLFQIADYVPGMVFSRAPDDGMALTFRGIGSPARSQAFEESIGLFMDGMFLAKARLYASAFFDLDRAELIKGTDSTLLGKNTSLGAISLVTRQPGAEYGADVNVAHEFVDGGETYDLGFDLPFTPVFAVREAIHYNDTSGWVKNTATGRSVPIDDDFASRTTAVLHPWETFSVSGSYQHSDNKRLGTPYQIVDPNLDPIYGEGVLNDREDVFTSLTKTGETTHISEVNFYNLKLQWDLGQYSLVSQTSRIDYNLDYDDDFDFSPEPWTDFIRLENYQQFTQELRLASPTGQSVEYIVGAFFFHSDWHSIEHQDWGVPNWPPGTPIAGQLFNGPFTNDFNERTDSKSGFASATWHFTDRWRLTTGLRYSDERKDTLFGRTNAAPLTIWNTLANPPFPATALPFSDSFLDGNANLQFSPSSTEMLYLAYGHGTKTGDMLKRTPMPTRCSPTPLSMRSSNPKWHKRSRPASNPPCSITACASTRRYFTQPSPISRTRYSPARWRVLSPRTCRRGRKDSRSKRRGKSTGSCVSQEPSLTRMPPKQGSRRMPCWSRPSLVTCAAPRNRPRGMARRGRTIYGPSQAPSISRPWRTFVIADRCITRRETRSPPPLTDLWICPWVWRTAAVTGVCPHWPRILIIV